MKSENIEFIVVRKVGKGCRKSDLEINDTECITTVRSGEELKRARNRGRKGVRCCEVEIKLGDAGKEQEAKEIIEEHAIKTINRHEK